MTEHPEIDVEALWQALNYGTSYDDVNEVEHVLMVYSQFMKVEAENGKPHGETAWWAMITMLRNLIHKRDALRARVRHGKGCLWVENIK